MVSSGHGVAYATLTLRYSHDVATPTPAVGAGRGMAKGGALECPRPLAHAYAHARPGAAGGQGASPVMLGLRSLALLHKCYFLSVLLLLFCLLITLISSHITAALAFSLSRH